MITLRPYQQEIIEKIREEWLNGKKRLVVSSPTGSGKTVLFSYMSQQAKLKGSNILILTHRDELLGQTSGTLQEFNLNPYVITAQTKVPPTGGLYVAMTKTLGNRLKKDVWKEWYRNIDLLVIDENHMCEFDWIFDVPETKEKYVLGFSATPKRQGKQRQLADMYESMVEGKDVQELINLGFLVTDRYFSTPVDLSGVSKSQGDYNTEEMYSRYNKQELYAGIIENWKRICPDTITIVFCCNIQHSINTCKAFNDAGISAKYVVSEVAKPVLESNSKADLSKFKIKSDEYENYLATFESLSGNRKQIMADWKAGKFKVLVNASIATTGFDFKPIQTVILNRATTSDNLLLQMVGRGSRPFDGKDFFYLLDFGENCKRLGYYRQQREYSLVHEVGKSGSGVPASKECPKCKSLIVASSMICKYCGYVFPKTRAQEVVELTEIKYSEAKKELKSIKDYEIYCAANNYNKNWLFRQIYIKWGKLGLIEYQKTHNLDPKWPYIQMARYRAQGIRNE